MKTYRTCVYVDGFNFYHAMDEKKKIFARYKILRCPNLEKLCLVKLDSFPDQTHTVDEFFIFTADINPTSNNASHRNNQKKYMKYFAKGKKTKVIHGKFVKRKGQDKEKRSDVNLAAYLINDAWLKKYDYAVVISNDTDFCGALNLMKKQFPNTIFDVWTVVPIAKDLKKSATISHQITDTELLRTFSVDVLKNVLKKELSTEDLISLLKEPTWKKAQQT